MDDNSQTKSLTTLIVGKMGTKTIIHHYFAKFSFTSSFFPFNCVITKFKRSLSYPSLSLSLSLSLSHPWRFLLSLSLSLFLFKFYYFVSAIFHFVKKILIFFKFCLECLTNNCKVLIYFEEEGSKIIIIFN